MRHLPSTRIAYAAAAAASLCVCVRIIIKLPLTYISGVLIHFDSISFKYFEGQAHMSKFAVIGTTQCFYGSDAR